MGDFGNFYGKARLHSLLNLSHPPQPTFPEAEHSVKGFKYSSIHVKIDLDKINVQEMVLSNMEQKCKQRAIH